MNKILAETLSILNGLFALAIILICSVIGKYAGPYCLRLYALSNGRIYASIDSQAEAFGVFVGLVFGLFVAVAVCGVLGLFIEMHRELKIIRQRLNAGIPAQGSGVGHNKNRIAPTIGS